MKTRRNGKINNYKFYSREAMEDYLAGKIPFEVAAYEYKEEPYSEIITHYEARVIAKKFVHYVYPEAVKASATKFLLVNKETGNVTEEKYLYSIRLLELVNSKTMQVMITNA